MIRRLRSLTLRVVGLFRSRSAETDFNDELESHLALHVDDNVRGGMTPEEARRDALIKLGGIAQTQEIFRLQHGLPMIGAAWQDLRHAFRVLLNRPILLATTTLSIGICVGVNLGVYSVLHRVLFEGLVTAEAPDRLVLISPGISYPNYLDLRKADLPIDLATMTMRSLAWRGSGTSETISAHVVSDNFFDVVGITPLMGQLFHASDSGTAGDTRRVVVTFGFWQKRLGSDPSIIGKTIHLDDDTYAVAAVLPTGFRSQTIVSPNIYLLTTPRVAAALNNRKAAYFDVIGRLRDNTTRDQAIAALRAAASSLEAEFPGENKGFSRSFRAIPLTGYGLLNEVFPFMPLLAGLLYGLVALVVLIACANVAGLLIARTEERRHETAVRIALGATRGRLAQQFLAESFVIAMTGCACGAVLWQGSAAFIRRSPAVVNAGISAVPDSLPLVYSIALALGVALMCGVAPAWIASQVRLTGGLLERRGRHHGRRFWLQRLLVSGQVAICFILLSAAIMLMLTFLGIRLADPGFDATHTISIAVQLPRPNANDFFVLREAVSTVSGVEAVSSDEGLAPPFTIFQHIRKADAPGASEFLADVARVGPRYLETMGIPIERGRDFTDSDFAAGSHPAVLANQTFVKRYYAEADPIGQRLALPGNPEVGLPARTVEIIGIARDNKAIRPNGDSTPLLYTPQSSTFLLVRVVGSASGSLRSLEQAIRRQKPEAAVTAALMTDRLVNALMPMRVGAFLIGILGGTAVLLAMTGLNGVVSYLVKRRSFEIGVRMALGATRSAVMRLILRESFLIVGLGCVTGGIAAVVTTRAIRTVLGIEQTLGNVVALVLVFILLLATGVVASVSPARRAATADPIVTLRHE